MSFQNKIRDLHPAMNQDRRMCVKAERNDDRGLQIGMEFGTDAPRGTCGRNGVSADAHRLVMAAARSAARAGSSERAVTASAATAQSE
jgi:hypothetical protein